MKHQDSLPHIARCGFCEQGLLRFMRCHSCTTVVAVCDECELVWLDIAAVKDDPQTRSSSAFPKCPACHSKHAYWSRLTRQEIESSSLSRYMAEEEEGRGAEGQTGGGIGESRGNRTMKLG